MSNEQKTKAELQPMIYSELAAPRARHALGVFMRHSSSHVI